ncbi:TIGR01777 family oxidoreductase [Nocardia sp. CDC159]|uniref:TIGR01777 family oxidoreductase n=1 Tax=Nocardia pulmonis TaxID=2951408 RepID=A0A9X2IX01_9NOCA|nr:MULTISPECIES: TIGR01777 family oxidoreductase [Nocardia]MCM6774114.1 TIGR01777 family oxidoreductase [Nocardia pulmonis]MCM6787001.1 TIGR01777 family oxidoreductase [Nocardia sp. CDC159]
MSIECSGVVAASRADVFEWFGRPGAFRRLAPPWQPVDIEVEAESLADGRAVLRLPGGLRWVAQHQAGEFDPPRRFVDEIAVDGVVSAPVGRLLPWRHTHEFEAVDDGHTRVIDRVETPIPAGVLRPMFDYRYRQIADDLAAHQRAAAAGFGPSTIAITGASGLVGSALTAFLRTGGHTVIRLVRHAPAKSDERQWDPDRPAAGLLDGVDAVVHLAGESIAGRFTAEHKRRIAESRIEPTRALAELAAAARVPTFVSASAVGFYGTDRDDEILDETRSRGAGFLADVVVRWEAATAPAEAGGVRVVRVRTGIVQSPRGGTLRLLRPLFAAGLGGRIGDGRQWLPWIGIDDLTDIYHRALWDTDLSGPVNATAPQPVRNSDYTRTLARVLHRPALLPIPKFGPALILGGEGVDELAAASQRAVPARLIAVGHHFRDQDLESNLRHLLGRTRG